jgi:hypothetical protein
MSTQQFVCTTLSSHETVVYISISPVNPFTRTLVSSEGSGPDCSAIISHAHWQRPSTIFLAFTDSHWAFNSVVHKCILIHSDVPGWASSPEPTEPSPFKPKPGLTRIRAWSGLGPSLKSQKPKPGAQARALISLFWSADAQKKMVSNSTKNVSSGSHAHYGNLWVVLAFPFVGGC